MTTSNTPHSSVSTDDDRGADQGTLETQIALAGSALLESFQAILDALPEPTTGPQSLATKIGIDKVLASRLLKALRSPDPISVIHRAPGPDPLRRVLKGASKKGVDASTLRAAEEAVDRFETLIRDEVGDRSSLDAIVSAWVPEARREFEIRRKQSVFKAISQLKGSKTHNLIVSAILHPSRDRQHVDVIWLSGVFGLQRLRPGAGVKFASRRMATDCNSRRLLTLGGEPIEHSRNFYLKQFCSKPLATLEIHQYGEVVHYTLADDAFGPGSEVDIVFGELDVGAIRRLLPAGSDRKGVFAEVSTPARRLQFDVFVHKDVFTHRDPALRIYDTSFEGVADANDPTRDIDQMHLTESIESLGHGLSCFRSSHVPRYSELIRYAFESQRWNDAEFRGYRCLCDYPLYGTQLTMLFDSLSQ